MSNLDQITAKTRIAGQLVFVAGFLAVSVLLLLAIGSQTAWVDGTKWSAQPRLWPAIGLGMMVLFTGIHLLRMQRRRPNRYDWFEAKRWLQPAEYAAWFMAYVWAVPIAGFLPASMVFAPVLTWRAGYRSRGLIWASVGFAIAVVILFKAVLQVKIPGGAAYEYLPAALRSFAILNL